MTDSTQTPKYLFERSSVGFFVLCSHEIALVPRCFHIKGYLPTNYERREATLASKREQYWHYVEQYFHLRFDDQNNDTFRQVAV